MPPELPPHQAQLRGLEQRLLRVRIFVDRVGVERGDPAAGRTGFEPATVSQLHADAVIGWAWSVFRDYNFATNPLGFRGRTVRALAATYPDHVWALDYQFDVTADGRVLNGLAVQEGRVVGLRAPGGKLLSADTQVCSCNNVTRGELCASIRDGKCTIAELKSSTRAGTPAARQ